MDNLNDVYIFNSSISPISMHHSQPMPYIQLSPIPYLTNLNITMNDTLNDTPSHNSLLHETQTYLHDHTNYMNATHTPKKILFLNGTYIHTSYD